MSELVDAVNNLRDAAHKHPLYKNVVFSEGNIVISRGNLSHPLFLFIGEAPGNTENKVGKPFVGRSGKLLDSWMDQMGIKDYAIINTVPIIPLNEVGGIRKPTKAEIEFFKPYVDDLIKAISPKYIICLGKSALEYLGISLDNCHWQTNIGFIYHPSYYLRRGQDGLSDFQELLKNIEGQKSQKSLDEF